MSMFSSLKISLKQAAGKKLDLREEISMWFYNLWQYTWGFKHLLRLQYFLKHLLWDRYDLIRTGLSKGQYHDKPVLILYGMMELIVDFVEKEKCFDIVDFDCNSYWRGVGDDIKEIYDWWKDYPNRQKEISVAVNNWHETKFDSRDTTPHGILACLDTRDTEEALRYNKITDYLENKLSEEETEMLIKIVKIRDALWT